MREQLVEDALLKMLSELPPEVAQRVREKYEADRDRFVAYVESHMPSKEPKFWAKGSCTKCNGRGILGVLAIPNGTSVTPACPCTEKNYTKWLRETRKQYNKEQGHETKAAD